MDVKKAAVIDGCTMGRLLNAEAGRKGDFDKKQFGFPDFCVDNAGPLCENGLVRQIRKGESSVTRDRRRRKYTVNANGM